MTIAAKSTKRLHNLVTFVTFVVAFLCVLVAHTPAQTEIGEPDLAAAGAGRTIRIGSTVDGRVTVIPLEVYVSRVLAGEGEPRAAEGAQQALAIAIRTYTLKNVDRHARDGFDLCDSTHCQVPRPSTPSSRRAAMATAGQVLTYRGDIAEVFYSASCGGRSERAGDVWPGADYPYLIVRKDDVCEDDPEWTADFTLRGVQAALARVGFEGERLENVRVDARTTSGRVARLHLSGLRPDVIGGNEFRLAVGAVNLRSTAFSVDRDGESLRFTGHGFGHGVGMCVIGAGRRAMRGESARAILAQYYPGLDLTLLSAVIPSAALTASPPRPAVPAPAASAVVPPGTTGIAVVVPRASPVSASELERMAMRAHADLAKTLGTSALPITIRLHDTLDAFRMATNRPWWVSKVADGMRIDLAPVAVLEQRGGLEASVRMAVAELLVAGALGGRPAWVRVGAARYFSQAGPSAPRPGAARTPCPSDAELTLAVSAPAQRDAEARAEACFAREIERVRDWRAVR
jgi:stage II sporulation protein D (peptidoglycan lytic transglycosylase)